MSAPRKSFRVTTWQYTDGGAYFNFSAPPSEFEDILDIVRSLPRDERLWLSDQRVWWIAASAIPWLRQEISQLGRYLDELEGHEQSTRQKGRPVAVRPPRKVADAFSTLCLTPDAPAELVAAARRVYAKMLHPDRPGGDLKRSQRLNDAADIAEEWLKRQCATA